MDHLGSSPCRGAVSLSKTTVLRGQRALELAAGVVFSRVGFPGVRDRRCVDAIQVGRPPLFSGITISSHRSVRGGEDERVPDLISGSDLTGWVKGPWGGREALAAA
jgi:hypothetical protein